MAQATDIDLKNAQLISSARSRFNPILVSEVGEKFRTDFFRANRTRNRFSALGRVLWLC